MQVRLSAGAVDQTECDVPDDLGDRFVDVAIGAGDSHGDAIERVMNGADVAVLTDTETVRCERQDFPGAGATFLGRVGFGVGDLGEVQLRAPFRVPLGLLADGEVVPDVLVADLPNDPLRTPGRPGGVQQVLDGRPSDLDRLREKVLSEDHLIHMCAHDFPF